MLHQAPIQSNTPPIAKELISDPPAAPSAGRPRPGQTHRRRRRQPRQIKFMFPLMLHYSPPEFGRPASLASRITLFNMVLLLLSCSVSRHHYNQATFSSMVIRASPLRLHWKVLLPCSRCTLYQSPVLHAASSSGSNAPLLPPVACPDT